jgi:hypothetical protein
MVFLSAYNGATYTFRVFLVRYTEKLLERHPSIRSLERADEVRASTKTE